MNFTNKKDTVRRTVMKKIKNSNIRHRMENKKTTVLFSFDPKTKIGVLSAEIDPSIQETAETIEINKKPPALAIHENKIILALQEVISSYSNPVHEASDRLVMHVTNAYLKNVDTPYSFIDSKRIKRIVTKYLQNNNNKKSKDSVSSESLKHTNLLLQEQAREIQLLKNELQNTKKKGVDCESKITEKQVQHIVEDLITKKYTILQKQIEQVSKQLPTLDESQVRILIQNIQKPYKQQLHEQIQDIKKSIPDVSDTKLMNMVQMIQKDSQESIQKQIKEINQKIPSINEEKIRTIVQTLQIEASSSFQEQIKSISKQIPNIDETRVQEMIQAMQNENNEYFQKQVQEITKKIPNIDEKKITEIVETLQTPHYDSLHKKIEDIQKQLPNIDEAKVKTIVQTIQNEGRIQNETQLQEIQFNISNLKTSKEEMQKSVEKIFLQTLEKENQTNSTLHEHTQIGTNLELIIERVVKRIIERENSSDVSIANQSDDNMSMNYDDVYGKNDDELNSHSNPIITYIMKEKEKELCQDYENITTQDTYETELNMDHFYGDKENIVHVNELRTALDKKWVPLGKGTDNTVMDMYIDPDSKRLYITGLFEQVDDVPAKNIASYDISQRKWSGIGNGINNLGVCLTMDIENQILYIGGIFSSVDTEPNVQTANNIVSYNLYTNEWETLGDGFNAECACLCFDPVQKKLYAGGAFTKIGEDDIAFVSYYDNVQKKWFRISDDVLNGPCRTMCIDIETNELYLGGVFTEIGDYMYYYVASFNTKSKEWTELCGGLQGHCNCLCLNPEQKMLYVGGTFNSVGTEENRIEAHHIASYQFEEHEWSPMGDGLDGVCHTMLYNPEQKCLVVGGAFTHTINTKEIVNHVVKYDTINHSWLPFDNFFDKKNAHDSDHIGLDGNCKSVCMTEDAYYVCGNFKKAGTIHANSVAKYLQKKTQK